jgi:hypothetical protein
VPDAGGEGDEGGGGEEHPAAEAEGPFGEEEVHDAFDGPHGDAGGEDEDSPEGEAGDTAGVFDGVGGHVPAGDKAGEAADHGGEEHEDVEVAFVAEGFGDEEDEDPAEGDEAHFAGEDAAVVFETLDGGPL